MTKKEMTPRCSADWEQVWRLWCVCPVCHEAFNAFTQAMIAGISVNADGFMVIDCPECDHKIEVDVSSERNLDY